MASRISPSPPSITPWKINMEPEVMMVCKLIFLFNWVILWFHVNLPARIFREKTCWNFGGSSTYHAWFVGVCWIIPSPQHDESAMMVLWGIPVYIYIYCNPSNSYVSHAFPSSALGAHIQQFCAQKSQTKLLNPPRFEQKNIQIKLFWVSLYQFLNVPMVPMIDIMWAPKKNKTYYFPLYWLVNKDPYFMVYYNPYIIG